MLLPGIVSVTFRSLGPERIVELAQKTHLQGIEWGGDIHVPPGNVSLAQSVAKLTTDAGLHVAAYGSYYRAAEPDSPPFAAVLDTAVALGAPTVRVWAGRKASADASPAERLAIVKDLQNICSQANNAGIRISLEFHGGTLTDTAPSTAQLILDADQINLDTYWQPPEGLPCPQCVSSICFLMPFISTLHVFHWTRPDGERIMHPLAEGSEAWTHYLRPFAQPTDRRPHWALLEFVRNNDENQFQADAASLLAIIRHVDSLPGLLAS